MKRSALLAVVIIGVALLTAGCDIFGGKADFFPMKVGSVWNYTWTAIMSDSMMSDTTTATVMDKAEAEAELTSGEKVVMFINAMTMDNDETYYDTTYIRKDGEKVLQYESTSDTMPQTVIDGPLAIDKSWTVGEDVFAKVVAKENVTVAAGTYKNCWKIAMTSVTDADTTTWHTWFADGTGQVKAHAEEEESGRTWKWLMELTSATIK